MPKLISKFSNGHTDVYNGKRAVKAGWMITAPDGRFATGHSLDAATARSKSRQEAINWVRFNRDWMKDLRIDGVQA